VVAISTIWLRNVHPDLPRPFRVPLGGVTIGGVWYGTVPVLALAFCVLMMGPVLLDIAGKAIAGEWIPAAILGGYILCGVALYAGYGYRRSRLGAVVAA
jgi:APA family basic amino acid/polyamine antiporter